KLRAVRRPVASLDPGRMAGMLFVSKVKRPVEVMPLRGPEIAVSEKSYVIGAASAASGSNARPARPPIRRAIPQSFIAVTYGLSGAIVRLSLPRCQHRKPAVSCGTAGRSD